MQFAEENEVGEVVTQIETQTDVTVGFKPPPANPDNPFHLNKPVNGNTWNLTAATVLDREVLQITLAATHGILNPHLIIDTVL